MPQHTIRLRLTVLYGVVSVLSAAGLLAITITLAGGWGQRTGTAHVPPASAGSAAGLQAALAQAQARLARLQAAFEAQRNFVANASHELRTPLSATRTMLEVVLADPDASAAALRSA